MRIPYSQLIAPVLCCTFVILTLSVSGCQPSEDAQVSDALTAEITSVYMEARNTPNLGLLDNIYAEDVVVHDAGVPEDIVGLEALKAYYEGSHTGFPDLRMEIGETFFAEDKIVFPWTVHGTHTGDLRGMPPTNQAVSFSGVAIDRIEDGLIVEEWVYYNLLDLMQQLGMEVVPAAGQGVGAPG
jgi:steroid delta-isomerase-like uncharacterized protein